MQFQINRDVLLKSLAIAHNIIERKNTLPILSNVLLEIKNSKLNVIATDLDLLFLDEISDFKIEKEGSTTETQTNHSTTKSRAGRTSTPYGGRGFHTQTGRRL